MMNGMLRRQHFKPTLFFKNILNMLGIKYYTITVIYYETWRKRVKNKTNLI